MGFVLLDITFRVEKKFGIRMPKNWPGHLGIFTDDNDITLLQFHDYLLKLCDDQRVARPSESWDALLAVIEESTGLDRVELTEASCLRKDIAPYG